MSPEMDLYTAQGVRLSYRIAGLGSRAAALMLDLCIQTALGVVISLLVLAATGSRTNLLAVAVLLILNFVLFFGYYIVLEGIGGGQTIGKRALGIRVVAADGSHCGWGRSILRNLMRVIDYLPFFYGIGIIMVAATKEHRRLGDFVGGTLVVYSEGAAGAGELIAGMQPDPQCGLGAEEVEAQLARLEPALLQCAELMRRRGQLLKDALARIAAGTRAEIEAVVGAQEATSDIRFLEHVMFLQQAISLPQDVREQAQAFPLTPEELRQVRALWLRADRRAPKARRAFLASLQGRGFLPRRDQATAWTALAQIAFEQKSAS